MRAENNDDGASDNGDDDDDKETEEMHVPCSRGETRLQRTNRSRATWGSQIEQGACSKPAPRSILFSSLPPARPSIRQPAAPASRGRRALACYVGPMPLEASSRRQVILNVTSTTLDARASLRPL